jgi:hypothetical protein
MVTVRESGGVQLDEEDYEYVRDLGTKGQKFHDVNALRELQQFFDDNDAQQKVDDLQTAVDNAIDDITQTAKELTGMNINYYPNLYGGQGGWRNMDTGYFIGKLDIQIDLNDDAYNTEMTNRVEVGFE